MNSEKKLESTVFLEDFNNKLNAEISRLFNTINEMDLVLCRINKSYSLGQPTKTESVAQGDYMGKLEELLLYFNTQNNRLRHISDKLNTIA
jgi:hypothetical protein